MSKQTVRRYNGGRKNRGKTRTKSRRARKLRKSPRRCKRKRRSSVKYGGANGESPDIPRGDTEPYSVPLSSHDLSRGDTEPYSDPQSSSPPPRPSITQPQPPPSSLPQGLVHLPREPRPGPLGLEDEFNNAIMNAKPGNNPEDTKRVLSLIGGLRVPTYLGLAQQALRNNNIDIYKILYTIYEVVWGPPPPPEIEHKHKFQLELWEQEGPLSHMTFLDYLVQNNN